MPSTLRRALLCTALAAVFAPASAQTTPSYLMTRLAQLPEFSRAASTTVVYGTVDLGAL